MSFRGSYNLSIDVKGRIAIPTRFRDEINQLSSGELVITFDPDGCLFIYTTPQWDVHQRELEKLPNLNAKARMICRNYIGNAADCEMDSQGRVLIPANLRNMSGLDKKAMLVGLGKKFELWDEDKWIAVTEAITKEDVLLDGELGDGIAGISL